MVRYEPIKCKDGFEMSVQANRLVYCKPQEDGATRYSQVEVGFPSEEEELLMPYAGDETKPIETVYAWVPVHVVSLVIAKHGGIVSGKVPPGVPYLLAL